MNIIEIYKGFEISKTKTGFRVTRLGREDNHTHLSSKSGCYNAVDYVLSGKIPKRTGSYYLTSLVRLSDNTDYQNKINKLIEVRANKGMKQNYFNPIKKK